MKRKLLLINPRGSEDRNGFARCKTTRFEPIGLAIVAALTPADDWDIKLIDENIQNISYEPADLVALSAFTSNVKRAYEISAYYRAANTPTVLGGIHASMMPEEALEHVDTVVVGEAEGSWPQVLDDLKRGNLKRIYGPAPANTFAIATPRRDVLRSDYFLGSIQTTRGCPMECDFCSVSIFNGRRYRQRPVDDVLDELEGIPQRRIFFVDDNLIGLGRAHQERALAIFKGMIERRMNKEWLCQASINIADNEELLAYAYRAGCRLVLIGVEAETSEALSSVNKKMNLRRLQDYGKAFRTLHQHGIGVIAAFIFGMDTDNEKNILDRFSYANRCGADVVQSTVLTPLPGTRIFDKFVATDRMLCRNFPSDWERFTFLEVVAKPKLIAASKMLRLMQENRKATYNLMNTILRSVKTLFATKSFHTAIWSLTFNRVYRKANWTSYKYTVE